jgi:hypothetical protein
MGVAIKTSKIGATRQRVKDLNKTAVSNDEKLKVAKIEVTPAASQPQQLRVLKPVPGSIRFGRARRGNPRALFHGALAIAQGGHISNAPVQRP